VATHTDISTIRGDRRDEQGNPVNQLRLWTKDDIVPRPDDIFQERLYCVRWVETYEEDDKVKTRRYYRTPTDDEPSA